MGLYPLFLDITNRAALVVGAGGVGLRKIASLAEAGPRLIRVADPKEPAPRLAPLAASGLLEYRRKLFDEADLEGMDLVFAATEKKEVNSRVAAACKERGLWCNTADQSAPSDFLVPAHFTKEGITVALGTGGQSPALSRKVRSELEAFVGTRYRGLAAVLGRLRPLLLAEGRPTEENTVLFRAIAASDLPALLSAGEPQKAEALLEALLPPSLQHRAGELLDEH